MKKLFATLSIATAICGCTCLDSKPEKMKEVNIIPRPAVLEQVGGTFEITAETTVFAEKGNKGAEFAAKFLAKEIGVKITDSKSSADIVIVSSQEAGEEAYTLDVTSDGVIITSAGKGGLFYGALSLKQLVDKNVEGTTSEIACVKIKDKPRFSWRGMHLDVSRHFYPKEDIITYLDMLAEYKINRFHWHLIDDGGWRLEIKKYPELTTIGAWRNKETTNWKHHAITFPLKDNPNAEVYGGFYSQEDVKEIVAYAAERNIVVVPEIEMPGHLLPVLACYPHFGSAPGNTYYSRENMPKGVDPEHFKKESWNFVHQNAVDVGKPEVIQFFHDVLKETMELFPSKWIHIGGDECRQIHWEHSKWVQALMKKEGLKNTHEVQAHFIKGMETFLDKHGRKLIGWDEIVDGGLGEKSMVMYWISGGRMRKALRQGNEVIMTPMGPTYFDFGYKGNSTEKVYTWDPMPEDLTEAEQKNLIGAQANVWTEWMNDWDKVQYMVLPRMLALAETTWSPLADKDFIAFRDRLQRHFQYFDKKGYNYRIPSPYAPTNAIFFDKETEIVLNPAVNPAWTLRYTTDGSEPKADSLAYTAPLKVTEATVVKAAYFTADGTRSEDIVTVSAVKPLVVNPAELTQGLNVQFYDFKMGETHKLVSKKDKKSYTESYFNMKPYKGKDNFSLRYTGFIKIEKDGEYTFSTKSDDGSSLALAGALVVDNGGFHGYYERSGTVTLKKGFYPIEVNFTEAGGAERLDVFMKAPGAEKVTLPKSLLFRKK